METITKNFIIGQTVTWVAGKRNCEGIVRDDFGKETVVVMCINIDGRRAYQKVNVIRDLLIVKNKKMDDIKKILLKGKFKKQSKEQLFIKIKEGVNDFEKEVIIELLISYGCKVEEILGNIKEEISSMIEIDGKEKFVDFKTIKSGKEEIVPVIEISEKPVKPKYVKIKVKKLVSRVSKSIILEESKEIKGLKAGDEIEFKPSPRFKIEGSIVGVIVKIYQCHKADFKEYCQIKNENGKIFYKRSNSLILK